MRKERASRRQFLKRAAATSVGAIGFPYIVPSSVFGADAPSNKIVMGAIGTGGQGKGIMGAFMGSDAVRMVAVCDVDTNHRNEARDQVNGKYGNQDCKAYNDFRELLEKHPDINAVTVCTPDHWHALCSVAAANAKKDIYCEKPLANSVAEGRAIANAVKKNKCVLQTGSHERSGDRARYACELVRNGRIGKLQTIEIYLPCSDGHHQDVLKMNQEEHPEQPVPEGFDYNFWLGHTPEVPYTEKRCHFFWRFNLSYGGGEMTDRGAHVIDIAQLGNGTDDTCPVEYKAEGEQAPGKGIFNTFFKYKFENIYANGVRMVGSSENAARGLKFIGEEGWIMVHIHGARLEASKPSILEEKIKESEINLGRAPGGHQQNFLDAVKSRKQPFASAEVGHRTASICHLNNIAMLTGKSFKWDPKKEVASEDAVNELLAPKMRSPWHL